MTGSIRAFVAVEPSAAMKRELARLIGKMSSDGTTGLRLTRSESVHLTLSFLGDIRTDSVSPIIESLTAAVCALSPFEIGLGPPGFFPKRGSPRVLWVGLTGNLPELAALQDSVAGSLAALGFVQERRAFNPHLTIGRFRIGTSELLRRRCAKTLLSTGIPTDVSMRVEEIGLIQSRLLPVGAVYERLASIPLGGGSPSRGSRGSN